ncbi:hypothetical protein C0992_007731 [Termitomyces sp. T32_za158]|nr:hypothetical protein C0992_007731 [Termitomyces sp. T32_za158]
MSHTDVYKPSVGSTDGSGIRRRPLITVDIEKTSHLDSNGEKSGLTKVSNVKEKRHEWRTPSVLQWIPTNFKYSKLRPVIRSAVAAWLALVLFVIPSVQIFFGQASFLILIASVLSPPSDPFLSVLEREVLIMLFASLSWAWSCLGIKIADLTRTNRTRNVVLADIVNGQYIEVIPAVILGVFIFLGSSFILFFRAHKGPGPYTIPCILACIYISLTTAVLYPFPFYGIGQVVVLPLVFHSAIALITSICVLPSSISAHFTRSLSGVLGPLISALGQHKDILATSTRDPTFSEAAALIAKTVSQADNALSPLAAASRLLRSDLIYGRYSPADFVPFQDLARRAAVRANGMGAYFSLIDPTRPRFPATPAASVPQTPALSRQPSLDGNDASGLTLNQARLTPISSSPSHSRQNSHINLSKRLHRDLLHFHPGMRRHENAVGVFESQRYMNLEATRLHDPYLEEHTAQMLESLNEWTKEQWTKQLVEHEQIRDDLFQSIERFRQAGRFIHLLFLMRTGPKYPSHRFRVLDLYRPSFEGQPEHDMPPHRHLFQAYLDHMIRLERERTTQHLWTPVERLFRWNNWQITDNSQHAEDEDPETIQGMEPTINEDLGMPLRRDPDSLPPRNFFESIMGYLYFSLTGLAGGNVLFGIKAGCLTLLLSLPFMFPSSSFFAYDNRFVWGIIMGQVTIARFQGDTIFGFVSRILATFLGGLGVAWVWSMWRVNYYTSADLDIKRRFVLVIAGVFAAFIASFLPPATTIRRYQRSVLATTCAEIGAIYCAIVSLANYKSADNIHEINLSLSAIRAKLIRSKVVRTNAAYEV